MLKLVVLALFRSANDDSLGVAGCRGTKTNSFSTITIRKWRPTRCWRGVLAPKLVVLAPFQFVSDDILGVGGVSWR